MGLIVGSESNNIGPDVIGDWKASDQRTVARWFNTRAFANVHAGQIRTGDAAAVALQGPGNIASIFPFNTPNHTNYQGLSTGITSANYGQITSAREARRRQLGLKLNF